MKKRTGRVIDEAIQFRYQEDNAKTLLSVFLKDKKAVNLSEFTIKLYSYHCNVFIDYLDPEGKLPGWKVCTLENYQSYIIHQQEIGTKDITIASQARSIKAFLYWLMENQCISFFKVVVPKYQETVPDTYNDDELAILLKKPSRRCTEVEYETWVFINVAIATGFHIISPSCLQNNME